MTKQVFPLQISHLIYIIMFFYSLTLTQTRFRFEIPVLRAA